MTRTVLRIAMAAFLAASSFIGVARGQTPKENLQRNVGSNIITGAVTGAPFKVTAIANLKAANVAYVMNGQQVEVAGYTTAGDGGGGIFQYASASAVADNGGTVIAPSAGSGRWLRVYVGAVSVAWFGAVGDGVTDDTAAIQRCIDAAADTREVRFSGSVYLVSGLTAAVGSQLYGNRAELRASANGVTVITVPTNSGGLQLGPQTVIDGLYINGNSKTSVIGLQVTNNAYFKSWNLQVDNCATGIKFNGAQFAQCFSTKVFNCGVGIYIKAVQTYGGGECNIFYGVYVVGCTVGVIASAKYNYDNALQPSNNNAFIGGVIEGNSQCAVVSFFTEVNLTSIKTEINASASAGTTYSYDGLTIKGAVVFANYGGTVNIQNVSASEGLANPWAIAETNSLLNISNVRNYGAGGVFTNCDTTSRVTLNGGISIQGAFEGVADACGMTQIPVANQAGCVYATPLSALVDHGITNEVSIPQLGPYAAATGTLASVLAKDALMGEVRRVTFDTVAGNTNQNITIWNPTLGATGNVVVAFNMMSDRDCKFNFQKLTNTGSFLMTLRAGVYYRIVWMFTNVTAGTLDFIVQPADASGPIVKFSRWHVLSGTNTENFWGVASRIVRGAWNPNMKTQKPYYEAASAPIDGTWEVADVIWNSAPSAGGNMGWVNTTGGSPGTFKTFGAIAP